MACAITLKYVDYGVKFVTVTKGVVMYSPFPGTVIRGHYVGTLACGLYITAFLFPIMPCTALHNAFTVV